MNAPNTRNIGTAGLPPVIELAGVTFSYNGQPALTGVDLLVKPCDFVAVIGPNGGGKTTLLKIILGLLTPQSGTARLFGGSPAEHAKRVGYVPQEAPASRSVPMTAWDVALTGRLRGAGALFRYRAEDRDAAAAALRSMGMWESRRKKMYELSGGQRQRVHIARALCSDPELLILDEPVASLDAQGRSEIYQRLSALNKEKTILVVTHDYFTLSTFIKSVACVNRGLFFHEGPGITRDMIEATYQCPVELVAHGVPHRVLMSHVHGPD
ncbi:MAG: metal ABC transporter ATP-binding protein, partial [Thermodesulfobacteriota bacterium]